MICQAEAKILYLGIIFFVIIILFDSFGIVFGSVTIQRKHILDRTGDAVDYNFGSNVKDIAKNYTDIKEIIYLANRDSLNATIWFSDFKVNPRSEGNVMYGAYIDYDSNGATGWKGIDYELQLRWENKSAEKENTTWTRTFSEWSNTGDKKTIDIYNITLPKLFEKEDRLDFYLNLKQILYPSRYIVYFYAAEEIGFLKIFDISPQINIPINFSKHISPKTADIVAGKDKDIILQIESHNTLPFNITLTPKSTQKGISFELENKENKILQIEPDAMNSTNLQITVDSTTPRNLYKAYIEGTYIPTNLPTIPIAKKETWSEYEIIQPNSQNGSFKEPIFVNIQEPLSWIEEITSPIGNLWNNIGGVANFLYVPLAALITWFFTRYTERRRTERRS